MAHKIVASIVLLAVTLLLPIATPVLYADLVWLEAESLTETGGWVVDQQFMDLMGSPYLLAHGLGVPVPDASTEMRFPTAGDYRVWVRTRDWVAPWNSPGAPGKFQVLINDKPLDTIFGTEGAEWHWQDGGVVTVGRRANVSLHDLTGFEGRCDALLFSSDHDFVPPARKEELATMRANMLGWTNSPVDEGQFDLIVVGGGIAGTSAAISAARLGLEVALIQDRPVLGGNGSSEVRVWPEGNTNLPPYPRIGDVVSELVRQKGNGDGNAKDGHIYDDRRKLALVRAEPNVTLMLEQRVNAAEELDGKLISVIAQHTRTGRRTRITGRWFLDSTGDGIVGALVGADYKITETGHMGASNLWNIGAVEQNEPQLKCLCEDDDPLSLNFIPSDEPAPFPRCPWAVDLSRRDFPGRGGEKRKPNLGSLGGWFWESGFDKDSILDMEQIRDQNLRAMYGAWDTLKNVDGQFPNHRLKWAAFIAGKRESRRLMGDVVLTGDDFRKKTVFEDAAFPCTWSLDLHLADKKYDVSDDPDPFISKAAFGKYDGPYWAPYRCLYSRNIDNLFMAGRDISVTHEALGAVRVMRTCGMMGEIVGMAASLCKQNDCNPRDVYESHLDQLKTLMQRGVGKSTPRNLALEAKASASSTYADYSAGKAIDGIVSNDARWVSEKTDQPKWLALHWPRRVEIAGVHIHTGRHDQDPLKNLILQRYENDQWVDINSSRIVNNNQTSLAIAFDRTIRSSAIRLVHADAGQSRVKELVVWADRKKLPPLGTGVKIVASPRESSNRYASNAYKSIPKIYLNQSGFNLGKPKRFTAPTLNDGTSFVIRLARQPASNDLYSGTIKQHVGDFSKFNPDDDSEYVVVAGDQVSVPFQIGPWHLERTSYQGIIDFMVDSRHYHGTHTTPFPGILSYSWRDDHHFAFELNSLVTQLLSNPQAYLRMKRQISYKQPHDLKLWGALKPYPEDAPDIVKMIHWGADVIVTQDLTHEQFKSQLAFFLYAWPTLQQWLPEQNYKAVSDYAFEVWTKADINRPYPYDETKEHNLLALKTTFGSTKGAKPPGGSVQPNLLMYEVARREGRDDAHKYFDAAYKQAELMVASLDWADPQTTKGQRMSEWLTMTGLSHFLREYPERAPQGLQQKIEDWVKVVIRRSDNMWDFRRLTDKQGWVPVGDSPHKWNEPGNVAGFPAALLAAAEHIENRSTHRRLEEIAYAHFDNVFGRNPTGRHFSYDAPREIDGVEHGWYSYFVGGAGQLEKVRYVLDGAPKNEHYPYHPEKGNVGHSEGWVNFNTAYNAAFAYLARHETTLRIQHIGKALEITLRAPLNFDNRELEPVVLQVVTNRGDVEQVVLKESSAKSLEHVGKIVIATGDPEPNNGKVELNRDDVASTFYGIGFMKQTAQFPTDESSNVARDKSRPISISR